MMQPRANICTPVFHAPVVPVRKGVYYSTGPYAGWAYWDGERWSSATHSMRLAFQIRGNRAPAQAKSWVGMRWPSLRMEPRE
jgi:hypothetical protein